MDDNDYVLAFDHFYTTNHIQILKSLIPFIEGEHTGMLPALIKYMERQYRLTLIIGQDDKDTKGIEDNIEQIYNAVHRYLAPNEEKLFSQLMSAMRTMKNMREMQQMLEMLQSLNPETDGTANTGGFGGIDINEIMQMFNQNGG